MQQDAGNRRTDASSADDHCLLQEQGRLRRIRGRRFILDLHLAGISTDECHSI
jgi:hypothetical protein